MTPLTIGISTGGGDCPGLNAVIRAATKCAIQKYGWRVMGIADGFDGLIDPAGTRELTLKSISGILPRGGTILGTTNRGNPFAWKTTDSSGNPINEDVSARVVENARKLGIDAVVVIGGDGTQNIGLQLYRKGLKTVGVPKTIDNDLSATEVTFGFDTALHTCVEAIDKLFSTAESHHRVMVCEVMGRVPDGSLSKPASPVARTSFSCLRSPSPSRRSASSLSNAKKPASASALSWSQKASSPCLRCAHNTNASAAPFREPAPWEISSAAPSECPSRKKSA